MSDKYKGCDVCRLWDMAHPAGCSRPAGAGPVVLAKSPASRMPSQQMINLRARYGVTNKADLLKAIAAEYTEETGERHTLRDADLMLDGMLEAEYQRIEGGAYDH